VDGGWWLVSRKREAVAAFDWGNDVDPRANLERMVDAVKRATWAIRFFRPVCVHLLVLGPESDWKQLEGLRGEDFHTRAVKVKSLHWVDPATGKHLYDRARWKDGLSSLAEDLVWKVKNSFSTVRKEEPKTVRHSILERTLRESQFFKSLVSVRLTADSAQISLNWDSEAPQMKWNGASLELFTLKLNTSDNGEEPRVQIMPGPNEHIVESLRSRCASAPHLPRLTQRFFGGTIVSETLSTGHGQAEIDYGLLVDTHKERGYLVQHTYFDSCR